MAADPLRPIADRLAGALIALDFDGTLAPIVADPNRSAPVTGAATALAALADRGARIAIVTGRAADTALRLSGLRTVPGLVISGLHGAELLRNGVLNTRDEPAGIQPLRRELPPLLRSVDPAVWLEDKRLSLVVHTRAAADPEAALVELTPLVTAAVEPTGLEVHPGHLVLEIRIPGLSKADAIAALTGPDTSAILYAGDDFGDLPAMTAVHDWSRRTGRPAAAVAVGTLLELQAGSDLQVQSPAELVTLLGRLLDEAPSPGSRSAGP